MAGAGINQRLYRLKALAGRVADLDGHAEHAHGVSQYITEGGYDRPFVFDRR